ncbi:hypothetical protein [Nitrosospira multiformis]|uniref:hypothetical protein n=1 Tax=Nitrosospira multiformis TaxID=1231 RepID=UPI000943F69B|nr:hypothetical protein [Nitrosospira multiformis]
MRESGAIAGDKSGGRSATTGRINHTHLFQANRNRAYITHDIRVAAGHHAKTGINKVDWLAVAWQLIETLVVYIVAVKSVILSS